MAVVSLSPTSSRILSRATLDFAQQNAFTIDTPGGLYPLAMAAFEMDDYRIMAGWPTTVPDFDVHADTEISSDGEILAFRDIPSSVETDSLIRWIADEDDTYDPIGMTWNPYRPNYDVAWQSSAMYMPSYVADYEYRVGQENFFANAINFDASSGYNHFWGNIDQVIGGGSGYSVVMVVNMHSVFGDSDHSFVGIWCPGLPTPDADTFTEAPGNYMSVTLRGTTLYLGTEQVADTKVLPIADLLASTQPFYLAMCFGRPNATIYAGTGVSSLRSGTVYTGKDVNSLSGDVVLGRSPGTRLNSADMAVLDLGIYSDKLSTSQVKDAVAQLVALYGGDA